MNELDKTIQQARKKHFLQTLIIGGLLLIGLLGYAFWLFVAKGYVLTIMPEEAKASHFVTLQKGQGLYLGGVLYTLSGQTRFEVGAAGFESETVDINASTDSTLAITLQPSPGVLFGRTIPSATDTEWTINGTLVHIGETLEHPMEPGEHTIAINHKYHQPLNNTVSIKRGEKIQKEWPLQTIDGQLLIQASPVTAEVYIDETPVGATPLSLERPAGRYAIKVAAKGYETIDENIEINNENTRITRQYQLAPRKGTVSFTLSPAGGVLIVDGVAIKPSATNTSGQTPVTVQAPIIANKKHTVRYSKPGYSNHTSTVSVSPGENKAVSIALKKQWGTLKITTSPAATVLIDGKPAGQSPLTTKLSTVKHKLEFVLPGYRTHTQYITPRNNTVEKIDVALLTEFAARQKAGKPLYVSTLGIDLLQLRPHAFQMGSPPNEKGRSRNEFQIDVDFSRKIWVSRHEITEAQYAAFDASKATSTLPVTDISWSEAAQYCNWLSQREGLPVFYTINARRILGFNPQAKGYRLLTEAEWEWLAKKAKRSTPTTYVWGNSGRIPKNAGNFADRTLGKKTTFYFKKYTDGFAGKAPVGSFKADRVGLYDLAGNVSEWVHDKHTNTPPEIPGVAIDYTGAVRGSGHIVKGGNYLSGRPAELRGAYRATNKSRDPTIGFRIARYH